MASLFFTYKFKEKNIIADMDELCHLEDNLCNERN